MAGWIIGRPDLSHLGWLYGYSSLSRLSRLHALLSITIHTSTVYLSTVLYSTYDELYLAWGPGAKIHPLLNKLGLLYRPCFPRELSIGTLRQASHRISNNVLNQCVCTRDSSPPSTVPSPVQSSDWMPRPRCDAASSIWADGSGRDGSFE